MDAAARDQIRAARREKGLSLRELGLRVGVSPSLLSQIENGRSNPSVSTLYAIVAELGVSLDSILHPTGNHKPRPTRNAAPATEALSPPEVVGLGVTSTGPVVSNPDRSILRMDSGVTWERLTRGPSGSVDALLVTYEPGGASSSTGMLMTRNSYEFAYLIEGELTLQLGFESHLIRAGDSLEFDASRPHLYVNNGDVPARGIWYVLDRPTIPVGGMSSTKGSHESISISSSGNPTTDVLDSLKRF